MHPVAVCTAVLTCLLMGAPALGAGKTIAVFVALADNKHQGIVPVPAALGDGEDPEKNLYWGSGEGFKTVFDRSKDWTLTAKVDTPAGDVLRVRSYQHAKTKAALVSKAYKGAAIRQCIADFEATIAAGSHDAVVFVGHNGLMDFQLEPAKRTAAEGKLSDVIVLCCRSSQHFKPRIEAAGGKPLVLTTQLMYPGSFLVQAAVDEWLSGGDRVKVRSACGAAYAKNQGISVASGTGIFADLR